MEYEVKVYREWETTLGEDVAAKFAPKIYNFDSDNLATVMESLDDYSVLQKSVIDGKPDKRSAASIGEALGRLHASTHSSRVGAAEAERLAGEFANEELRQVQLEHVFSKAFGNQKAAAKMDVAAELERLKALYRGEGQENCLCHGDLRIRSVMENTSGEVKLLDPEFAIYGPAGLDVGSLISGYVLAFVASSVEQTTSDIFASKLEMGRLRAGISQVWASYAKAMADGGVAADVVERVGKDAAAFACVYMAQDALVGKQSLLQMADEALEAKAKKHALEVSARCLKAKDCNVQGLIDELRRLDASIAEAGKSARR